jgi:hypothetical protein
MNQPEDKTLRALQNLKRSNPESYKEVADWITQNMLGSAMSLSDIKDVNEIMRAQGRNQVFKMFNLYFSGSDELIAKVEEYRKQATNTGNAIS